MKLNLSPDCYNCKNAYGEPVGCRGFNNDERSLLASFEFLEKQSVQKTEKVQRELGDTATVSFCEAEITCEGLIDGKCQFSGFMPSLPNVEIES